MSTTQRPASHRPSRVLVWTFLLLLLASTPSVLASASETGGGIQVDAVNSGSTDTDRLTVPHPTSGTDRLMVVGISIHNAFFETVTTVTYNGVDLDFLGSVDNADDARVEIWTLVAPPTGTHEVVVNFSADLAWHAVGGVITLTGVDQDTPLGPIATRFGDGTSANVTIASESGDVALAVFGCETCTSMSIDAPEAERWNVRAGAGDLLAAGATRPGASPTVTLRTVLGSSDHWAAAGVSIRSTPPVGTPLPPWSGWLFGGLLAAAGGFGALAWWRRREKPVGVEEVFVVDGGGTLIAHRSRTILQNQDEDLVVAMFTAIQAYIRNVFSRGTEERIRSLEFGDRKILIEPGRNHYVAVVFRGRRPGTLQEDLKALSRAIDEGFGEVLEGWKGDTEQVGGIDLLLPQVWKDHGA